MLGSFIFILCLFSKCALKAQNYNIIENMKLIETKEMKRARKELAKINKIEEKIKLLSDEELKAKTEEFKQRYANGESLDSLRVEAFAVAREASWRVLEKRPFDVQILGGLVLDYGSVAEMKTGEGKTITSIMPVYLNALSGEGVIVSTVNEYLTARDAEDVGRVHKFLGLTVGINLRELSKEEKRAAYAADITYSVHSEIGFDYLRDNMVPNFQDKVQRGFNYALIDEVDSILIDEAKTPLIISGGSTSSSQIYMAADQFVKSLKKEDYDIDWESKSIQLNDAGIVKANNFFGVKNIFEMNNSELVHRIQNALRAVIIMDRDVDYIVSDGKIMIVDAFTGRVMEGRSFSEGLHQSIQAKENVEIEPETKTLATITYQNLFRMFKKLCGMSGTAKTEEDEFLDIYNMRVNVVPTNRPIARKDQPDYVFASREAKYKAIVKEVSERFKKGQPVLLGTEEVSESEKLSELLRKANVKHTVLNAKQNSSEAEIIAEAGKEFAVTIATNMAGRGTDIKPTPKSLELGGLYVLGTSKAESRRIDNQLKGRSGRQGDVGESRFFLSLDDKLITRFANHEKIEKSFAGWGDNHITQKSIVKVLDRAQKKIEGFNFDSRKNVLQYDDVIRQQRDLIYAQRDIIIKNEDLYIVISRMLRSVVKDIVLDKEFKSMRTNDGDLDTPTVARVLNRLWFNVVEDKINESSIKGKTPEEVVEVIDKKVQKAYKTMRTNITENTSEEILHSYEREILLRTFDQNWQLHIDKMSKLKTSSSMASFAQKNPYQVYVEEGAVLFKDLLKRISHNTVKLVMTIEYGRKIFTQDKPPAPFMPQKPAAPEPTPEPQPVPEPVHVPAAKPAAKKPVAKKATTTAKKPATTKAADAKKTTVRKTTTATKKPVAAKANPTAAKKPAAKKPATTKATTAKKAAAPKSTTKTTTTTKKPAAKKAS